MDVTRKINLPQKPAPHHHDQTRVRLNEIRMVYSQGWPRYTPKHMITGVRTVAELTSIIMGDKPQH